MKKILIPFYLLLIYGLGNVMYAHSVLYNVDLKHNLQVYSGKGLLGTLNDNNWNGMTDVKITDKALTSSIGSSSLVTFSTNGFGGGFTPNFTFGLDDFRDYWYISSNNKNAQIIFKGLTANENYKLVLFCNGGGAKRPVSANVNNGPDQVTLSLGNEISWNESPHEKSNLLIFEGKVPGNGIITINFLCVNEHADIQGLQLQVGTPTKTVLPTRAFQLARDLESGYTVKTMCIGTSLTDLPFGVSWPSEVYNKLWQKYLGRQILSNRALSSTNSSNGKKNIDDWVTLDNPDVVFIEYGINDATGIATEQVINNIDYIINSILTNNPNADIIFQTMNNADGKPAQDRPKLEEYYQLYIDYANARGCTIINNYPLWKNLFDTDLPLWKHYVSDSIHPSSEGRKAVVIDNMVTGIGNAKPRTHKPALTIKGGDDRSVVLESPTTNARIYYTIDGTIPTIKSELYKSPIKFTEKT